MCTYVREFHVYTHTHTLTVTDLCKHRHPYALVSVTCAQVCVEDTRSMHTSAIATTCDTSANLFQVDVHGIDQVAQHTLDGETTVTTQRRHVHVHKHM